MKNEYILRLTSFQDSFVNSLCYQDLSGFCAGHAFGGLDLKMQVVPFHALAP